MARNIVLEIDEFWEIATRQRPLDAVWHEREDGVIEIPSTVAFFNKLSSLLLFNHLEEDESLSPESQLLVSVIVMAFLDLLNLNNSKRNSDYYTACRFLLDVDGMLQHYCDLLRIEKEPLVKLARDIILGRYKYKRRAREKCASDCQNQPTL